MLGGFLCYKLCPRLMGLLGQEDGETVAQLVKQLVTNQTMCTSAFIILVVVTICTHLIAHSREFQRAEKRFLISTSHFTNGETRTHRMRELAKISQKVIQKFRKKSQGSPPHLDTCLPTCRCCQCHSRKPETENRSQTLQYILPNNCTNPGS